MERKRLTYADLIEIKKRVDEMDADYARLKRERAQYFDEYIRELRERLQNAGFTDKKPFGFKEIH